MIWELNPTHFSCAIETVMDNHLQKLAHLRRSVEKLFSEGELKIICFDLGIDYELFPKNDKSLFIVEMLRYLEKLGRLNDFVIICQDRRPNHMWITENKATLDLISDADIDDPLGSDVIEFAAQAGFRIEENDENEDKWSYTRGLHRYETIEGFWSSRWYARSAIANYKWQCGTAQITQTNDWVFIYCEDPTNQYLIKAKFVSPNRLLGRYKNISDMHDATPWIGIVVSNYRIDGTWTEGRWDFRR